MNIKPVAYLFLTVSALFDIVCLDAKADLPTNFPPIVVTTYDSNKIADGYIFLAVASVTPGIGTYAMVLQNDGTPVWYQELSNEEIYDFKVQPNGYLSYAPFIEAHSYTGGGDVYHEIRDDSYALRETVTGGNSYVAEGHDFRVLPNGNVLQTGYYMSEVDMSQIVAGGHPAALVSGGLVQELDAQRNVVWQWRAWDHYSFSDELTSKSAVISAFHLNDLFLDWDGNLVVGTPTEIRKINRQTGEVMWTLGGPDNEFTAIGPGSDIADFGGHGTYRLENGNFLMYDNGNRPGTVSSTVHEYKLDEVAKTASNVWNYVPDTIIPAWHRGNAQRLPNGNTFIGWGGAAASKRIPACTEVTPTGEKVFELYFGTNSPPIESYRAFRFKYPPATQKIEFMQTELATGNSYDFTNTGVSITVNSGGGGYNEATVRREPYAPVYPLFQGKAPRVLPVRVSLTESDIGTMNARIEFDAVSFGFADPTNLTVYYRTQIGQEGLFLPQTKDYNSVTKKLRVTMTLTSQSGQFGEFIFGYPDVADVAYPPMLAEVENYRGIQTHEVIAPKLAATGMVYTVNQELPVLLSWSPKGFARWYQLQIATNQDFASPVVDIPYQTDGFKVWSNAAPDTTYFYRVKTWNEGGESDWSSGSFQTVAPMVAVVAPSGGEAWQRGLTYFIQWKDNIAEDVVIDLYKNGIFLESIATNASTGAYQWEVGLNLVAGNDYSIKIMSATDGALFDVSDMPFDIDVPKITGIQQSQDGSWILEWEGSSTGVYVEFNPTLAPGQWQTIGGPTSGSNWTNTPPAGLAGFYRLRLE